MNSLFHSGYAIFWVVLVLLRGSPAPAQNSDCSGRLALQPTAHDPEHSDKLFREVEWLLSKPVLPVSARPLVSSQMDTAGWNALKMACRYLASRDFKTACRYAELAFGLAGAGSDRRLEMMALNVMGSIAEEAFPGVSLKAVPYHEKALAFAWELRDTNWIILQLLELADNYGRAGQNDCFLHYLKEACDMLAGFDQPVFRISMGLLAGCFLEAQGELPRTENIFRLSLNLASSSGDQVLVQHLYWRLFWVYLNLGDALQAKAALDSVQRTAPEVKGLNINEMRYRLEKLHSDQEQDFLLRQAAYQFLNAEYGRDAVGQPYLSGSYLPKTDEKQHREVQRQLLNLMDEQKKGRLYQFSGVFALAALLFFVLVAWYKQRQTRRAIELLHLSVRRELMENAATVNGKAAESADAWLQQLRETVRENLRTPQFNVDHLAGLMGISRTALYRLVHEKANMSANQLIQELRLLQARELLESGQYANLRQVADAVGFRSADYFSRLYRARFGKSPAEYLNKAKNNA